LREFIPRDDFGEQGQYYVGVDNCRERSIRRRGGPCPDKTVSVSATIRMAGASLCARRVDLGLDFFHGEGWQVQRIELGEGLAESLGGRIASPLFAGLEEVSRGRGFESLHFHQ
jgi:hypothetical protein